MSAWKNLIATFLICTLAMTGCAQPDEEVASQELKLHPQPSAPSAGLPTTYRLVLRVTRDRVELLTAKSIRGTLLVPAIDENRAALLTGARLLVEYVSRDPTGRALNSGYVVVPMQGEVEFLDPDTRHRIRRATEPLNEAVVRVAIPYDRATVSVEFQRLIPDPGMPPKKWRRSKLGAVAMKAGESAPQRPREKKE